MRETLTDALAALGKAVARRPDDSRARAVAVGAALLLALAVILAIVAAATIMHPAGQPRVGEPENPAGYAELPGRPQPSASPSISRSPSASPGPGGVSAVVPAVPDGAVAPLTATYKQESSHLGGYKGQVTVVNPGDVPVTGWTVVVTIPVTVSLPLLGTTVRAADGAAFSQENSTVTFTPRDATRVVGARGQVVFTFDVDGVAKPQACTVNGQPCAGVGNSG